MSAWTGCDRGVTGAASGLRPRWLDPRGPERVGADAGPGASETVLLPRPRASPRLGSLISTLTGEEGEAALSPSSLPDLGPSWGGSQQHHRPLLRTCLRERRKPAAPHAARRPSLWGALCRATARRLDLCSAPWGQLPSPLCPAALSSWSENEALGRVSPDTPREPAGRRDSRTRGGRLGSRVFPKRSPA